MCQPTQGTGVEQAAPGPGLPAPGPSKLGPAVTQDDPRGGAQSPARQGGTARRLGSPAARNHSRSAGSGARLGASLLAGLTHSPHGQGPGGSSRLQASPPRPVTLVPQAEPEPRCPPDEAVGQQVGADTQRIQHIAPYLQQQLGVGGVALGQGVPAFVRPELQEHCGEESASESHRRGQR